MIKRPLYSAEGSTGDPPEVTLGPDGNPVKAPPAAAPEISPAMQQFMEQQAAARESDATERASMLEQIQGLVSGMNAPPEEEDPVAPAVDTSDFAPNELLLYNTIIEQRAADDAKNQELSHQLTQLTQAVQGIHANAVEQSEHAIIGHMDRGIASNPQLTARKEHVAGVLNNSLYVFVHQRTQAGSPPTQGEMRAHVDSVLKGQAAAYSTPVPVPKPRTDYEGLLSPFNNLIPAKKIDHKSIADADAALKDDLMARLEARMRK